MFVPYLVLKSRRQMLAGAPIPPLRKQFKAVVITQAVFLFVALFAAQAARINVFVTGSLSVQAVAMSMGIVALGLVNLPMRWRGASHEEKLRIMATRPQRVSDLSVWFGVSLAAGVVEEIVYRGVTMRLVEPMTGSWWVAVLVCVVLFTVGHATQGWARASAVGVLAVGFHLLVRMTGALYLAMVTHFVYDFLAGVMYIGLARQMQATPAGEPTG